MVFRRRLVFWLLKAYIRKWGKVILISFIGGLIIFFALLRLSRVLVNFIPIEEKTTIGIVGAYTINTLPPEIVFQVSQGLTKIESDGTIKPGAATGWEIEDGGKTYIFTLPSDVKYSDGKRLTSENVTYEFSDVSIEKPDERTIIFRLNDSYSPFLVTASRPLLRGNLAGLGEYKVEDIELNGNFVKSLLLVSREDQYKTIQYLFYPSEEALKIAFAMGEIEQAHGLTDVSFNDTNFESFPNIIIEKNTNYRELVTLFYNNADGTLSDPKLRKALTYGLPDTYQAGEKSEIPYPKTSKFSSPQAANLKEDLEHANLLLDATEIASSEGQLTLTIKSLPKYIPVAQQIAKNWEKLEIKTVVEEVTSVPSQYQIYLGDFLLPRDPDQYTLWHSAQPNNITRYKNLRIDKLLEDGRKETNPQERMKIYADFQKYLLEDSPAAFLYFPYEYNIIKN